MQDFEKPGQFYLGRHYDLPGRRRQEDLLLYAAKDLTTHAVCVGMTGSGKTGLCLALLEEAAIDGIPVIAIDPKGDVGNLLLAFPELRSEDFRPWIEEAEAERAGVSPDELAAKVADRWRQGLAEWGQDGARIARFCAAADAVIYTPGSSAGLPLSVLRSFDAPPAEILEDADLLRDRIGAAASGLLTLVGVDADPINSREHILLAQLLENAWRAGQSLDVPTLVRQIQAPPLERVGSVDLETFYPSKARGDLALRLNNLLASPSFAGWMEGEPLSIPRLLHTPQGQPRLSILSIAHLSDAERMFFVTILLNELLAWVRTQSGTSGLRAILYMDEVFGYFPPTANPPSKKPMLTLLKQARAFGLGVVLATQNPVDLDYKGLSNAGTWFLGRLQTERDKARVLEGLEGASAAAGSSFNRGAMEATLAGLGQRVFLLNSVHEDQPLVFESRWCLSYLRGPLTRGQIQTLMASHKADQAATAPPNSTAPPTSTAPTIADPSDAQRGSRPLLSPDIAEVFLLGETNQPAAGPLRYRPALLASARVHYVDSKANLDHWQQVSALVPIDGAVPPDPWTAAHFSATPPAMLPGAIEGAEFAPLPGELQRAKSYADWSKELAGHLYRDYPLKLLASPVLKMYSSPEESPEDFERRATEAVAKLNAADLDKVSQQHQKELASIDQKITRLETRITREKSRFWTRIGEVFLAAMQMLVQLSGSSKWNSQRNVSTTKATARSAGRIAEDRATAAQLNEELAKLREQRDEKEAAYSEQAGRLQAPPEVAIEEYAVPPRKSDISVQSVSLAWLPE